MEIIGNRSHVLLTGDFNQPDINWESETAKFQSRNELEPNDACTFLNFYHDSYLFQHVHYPTHFRSDQKPTLIDLILSSEEDMVQTLCQKAPVGKSHHQMLHLNFVCYSQLPSDSNCGVRYNYKKANFIEMRKTIHEYGLTEKLKGKTVQEAWNCVVEALDFAVDQNVPKIHPRNNKEQRTTGKHYSLDKNVIEKIKSKGDAYEKWLQTRDSKDYAQYAKHRNQVKSLCRKSDRDYEMKIAKDAKNNPKIFYGFAKKKLRVREGIGDLKENEETISSNEGKADCLNKFFCSVFTEENLESIPSFVEMMCTIP